MVSLSFKTWQSIRNIVRLCFRFICFRNQEIGVIKLLIIDIIEICDDFTV